MPFCSRVEATAVRVLSQTRFVSVEFAERTVLGSEGPFGDVRRVLVNACSKTNPVRKAPSGKAGYQPTEGCELITRVGACLVALSSSRGDCSEREEPAGLKTS